MQVPTAIRVAELPLTVHTEMVSEENVTGSPDEALATSANGAVPKALLFSGAKVIVWTVRGCVTEKL